MVFFIQKQRVSSIFKVECLPFNLRTLLFTSTEACLDCFLKPVQVQPLIKCEQQKINKKKLCKFQNFSLSRFSSIFLKFNNDK